MGTVTTEPKGYLLHPAEPKARHPRRARFYRGKHLFIA